MNVGINGFGRIGRLILRAFFESKKKYNFNIVAVNDLEDVDTAIHLLKHDSVHGGFNAQIRKISSFEFEVNGKRIFYSSKKNPQELLWGKYDIDLVMECTGKFRTGRSSEDHLIAGAKRVLISAPSDDADNTVVFGVNEKSIDPKNDIILSNASCTTNCLAPVVKAIHEKIGIVTGFATTIHSFTGDQRLVDMPHKDLRRARAAANNMIPTSTGATKTLEKIFPELQLKLSGLSVRVPTANVSLVDFTFTTARDTTADEINKIIREYSDGALNGILGYTAEELVSSDFNHDPRSSIVDLSLTKVIDKRTGHIVSWYDNEWGFSNRMLDVAEVVLG